MEISASQLQTKHRHLVDALRRGEDVTILYHGNPIGIAKPMGRSKVVEEPGADDFFGMHKGESIEKVENELRELRSGRGSRIRNAD